MVPGHPEAEWEEVLDAEPHPAGYVGDIDTALSVMADFVDLKSPWTRGHSTRVAGLAKASAVEAGLGCEAADDLFQAGLVHDLGRIGVENGIWDKSGGLSTDEWEKVRIHPYLTHRILSRCAQLEPLARFASSHHERVDGSGHHRQATAENLPMESRLLAAADVLASLLAARPHRERLDLDDASDLMRQEARDGRLDRHAVECVVAAAGGTAETRSFENPDGLTDREVEVLRLICGGHTNRAVADLLFISPKTVGRHVENIYAKAGVSTRAGAAVYAMERRLLE